MIVKVLSHACMLIKGSGGSIIVDPWLLGSCYWRPWWNYPREAFDEQELAAVDAVVITHVHWDHWLGPTLRRFFTGKQVIVSNEPNSRSRRDLGFLGFTKIVALPHGKTIVAGGLNVKLYQFGLFLKDAALVVEDQTSRILNANDAKIAGPALTEVCRRRGPFDLAFRSHSSANPRIRFRVVNQEGYIADDREHYFRSFKLFMSVVKPKFTIPFASNHCHLHDDVFALNSYVSNSAQLAEYLKENPLPSGVTLQQMLPGAS
jgi:UDP-MurNAc hydroxylase